MTKSGKIAALTLLLIRCLWVHSSSANQSVKTFVSKGESRNPGLLRSSTILFTEQKADSVAARAPHSPKLKSPTTATILAIFPGVAVHGLGHFYAGADSSAWGMLAVEGISLAIVGLGFLIPFGELAYIPAFCASLLFLVSWWADMMLAPEAVKEHNKRVLEQQKTEFGFQFHQRNDQMGFRVVAGF